MTLRSDIEDAADTAPRSKISKQKAGYKDGLPQAHCGICRHFEMPHACEIVSGRIDPEKWCRYFARKRKE